MSIDDTRTSRRLSTRELLFIVLFWMSLATLSSLNRLLDPRGFGFRMGSPAAPIVLAYVESAVWAVLTPLIFQLSSRFSVDRSRWLIRIPALLAIGLVIAVTVYVLLDLSRAVVLPIPTRRGAPPLFSPLRDFARFRFLNQLLVYCAILAAGFAREYFLRDQERTTQAATLQAQLADARLATLRMQLNPHFLFNTLHAISALVERDPPGVRKMIARLSELLRLTMESSAENEVPLREELALLRRYIEIMEIRFQGQLQVSVSIDESLGDALVPNLVLQPIVENALEHGAARATSNARVEIAAQRLGSELVLTVRDNGPGITETNSGGVGLANTRARLAQLYGSAASFVLTSRSSGGAIATITLPFHTE